jgi:hypothetical protein
VDTREQLGAEIEATRRAYHHLLAEVPESAYGQPSGNPAWTIGDVLYHMSLAPRLLGTDLKLILNFNWAYRLIPLVVPKALFNGLNARLTRFGARRPSRTFFAKAYDRAHGAALRALDTVPDSAWQRRVYYPDWDPLLSGWVTVERLFHYVGRHYESHAEQIRARLTAL